MFSSLKQVEVVDESGYRRNLGIFLVLLKKFSNLEKFSIKSQDRNINIILQECLICMPSLKELYIDSTASRAVERFKIIKIHTPNLEKLFTAETFFEKAVSIFEKRVKILKI